MKSHHNGIGNGDGNGDGNGIKISGTHGDRIGQAKKFLVEHNISYRNRRNGFSYNSGSDIRVQYNTSYANGSRGFACPQAATQAHLEWSKDGGNIFAYNISWGHWYQHGPYAGEKKVNDKRVGVVGNNWQAALPDNDYIASGQGKVYTDEQVEKIKINFISVDSASPRFLEISSDSRHSDKGAYYGIDSAPSVISPGLNTDTTVPIWIIGDSTVATFSLSVNYRGWGQMISEIMKNPSRISNRARGGRSSKDYRHERGGDPLCWGIEGGAGVKEDILSTDTSRGGFLFIQFGENDEYGASGSYNDTTSTVPGLGNEYDQHLTMYIDFAKANNLTPVLVTASPRMYRFDGGVHDDVNTIRYPRLASNTPAPWEGMRGEIGDWPETKEQVANREGVVFINLMDAAKNHYATFPSIQAIKDKYSVDGVDNVHFNETGARKMANMIRALALNSSSDFLKSQFLPIVNEEPAPIPEGPAPIPEPNNPNTNISVWIIGDSTVSTYEERSIYKGWGQYLEDVMVNKNVKNRARSGASAKSFYPKATRSSGDGTFNGVKADIVNTDTSKGGFLFIQFGINDVYRSNYKADDTPLSIYDKNTVPGLGK